MLYTCCSSHLYTCLIPLWSFALNFRFGSFVAQILTCLVFSLQGELRASPQGWGSKKPRLDLPSGNRHVRRGDDPRDKDYTPKRKALHKSQSKRARPPTPSSEPSEDESEDDEEEEEEHGGFVHLAVYPCTAERSVKT